MNRIRRSLQERAWAVAAALHSRLARVEGQTTAEYGLVVIAAAGIAAALIAFANANIGKLFAAVFGKILDAVGK